MSNPPDRIYVQGGIPPIDMLRPLRAWIEQHAAREGKTLDTAWYRDSPQERPELNRELRSDHLPAALPQDGQPT